MPRYINLVFQGGGVRGIAYVGALEHLFKTNVKIHSVGGTSAGAIVAALLALGTPHQRLKEILESPELFSLVSKSEIERREFLEKRLKELLADFQTQLGWLKLLKLGRKYRDLLPPLRDIWHAEGLHSYEPLRQWFDKIFGQKKFSDIVVEGDLKIVAADISARRYKVYEKEKDLDTPIAEAVHASASIPGFFTPLKLGPRYFVDGGVLSNFPSFLFAKAAYPTIGFRLSDLSPAETISSTGSYLKNLLFTMVEAHDAERGVPPRFKSYRIPTAFIPSMKFNLSADEVTRLYDAGFAVGSAVDWNIASNRPAVAFWDKQPDEALQFSISKANELYQKLNTDRSLWAERLEQEVDMTVRVEQDWSTYYERTEKRSVSGPRPLFAGRLVIDGGAVSGLFGESLVDVENTCVEVTLLGEQEMIRVPAVNEATSKGFVIFYIPPITEGVPRQFKASFRVPYEFTKSLGGAAGGEGTVGWGVRQIADVHHLKLTIRVLTDASLPKISCTPQFGLTMIARPDVVVDNKAYHVFECDTAALGSNGVLAVTGQVRFEIKLKAS